LVSAISKGYCQDHQLVRASTYSHLKCEAHAAIDGDRRTRWASKWNRKEPEWLLFDFGRQVSLGAIEIHWEAAYAKEYAIFSSSDRKKWTCQLTQKGFKGGVGKHNLKGRARYVKIECLKYGPHTGFSIWEVEFKGKDVHAALQEIERKRQKRMALLKEKVLEAGVKEIVFAERVPWTDAHWYGNFGYYAASTEKKLYHEDTGTRLCKLNVTTGRISVLLEDASGTIRDPVVHYGARKILFSYRKGGTDVFHLYEIGVDGKGIRQLTSGRYDDIEPTYLPDGGIMFVSGRGKRWVNCWLSQVGILYRCDADGKNVRQISGNIEHDNTPWVLPDGRVLFQRWEYVDRSEVHYHHLWTANPDGTGQMVYYGNQHPGGLYIDAKPIPDSSRVVFINSPGHGRPEHEGWLATVSDQQGPDHKPSLKNISRSPTFRDPWAFSESCFMAARRKEIVLMDAAGQHFTIHRSARDVHEPRPIIKRKPERIMPSKVDLSKPNGTLVLTDAYFGRNMGGIKRGEIKKLLILETLPKPINYTGEMTPISLGGTFTIERILGTVPVEKDGSANFELPANRAFILAALDSQNRCVKRMQSFLTVMPGETASCLGCHENRTSTPKGSTPRRLVALRRPPSKPTPVPGVPDIFDFPRDIQPILDKHCVKCHNPDKRSGGVLLTGDRGPIWTHSYCFLTWTKQFRDGRNQPESNYPPRALGDYNSPLMNKLNGGHKEVRATPIEIEIVRHWINAGAYYAGTYAALGTGMIGVREKHWDRSLQQYVDGRHQNDLVYPEVKAIAGVLKRRCSECHKGDNGLPLSPSRGSGNWRAPREVVYNLTRPEKSIMLLAPLARTSGGWGMQRRGKGGKPSGEPVEVFKDTKDPDYRVLLKGIQKSKWLLDRITSFEMPNFKPRASWVREMKRFGIIPASFELGRDNINVYDVERRYWRSLWYYPPSMTRPSLHRAPFPYPKMDNDNDKPRAFWLTPAH